MMIYSYKKTSLTFIFVVIQEVNKLGKEELQVFLDQNMYTLLLEFSSCTLIKVLVTPLHLLLETFVCLLQVFWNLGLLSGYIFVTHQ